MAKVPVLIDLSNPKFAQFNPSDIHQTAGSEGSIIVSKDVYNKWYKGWVVANKTEDSWNRVAPQVDENLEPSSILIDTNIIAEKVEPVHYPAPENPPLEVEAFWRAFDHI
ncbi:MAG TPA: hypothetical protein VNX68_09495, partial [Nitrosopumilaceae archaeon]|nr:hypothetical protein [Nitrosopumilaceae archaeon]